MTTYHIVVPKFSGTITEDGCAVVGTSTNLSLFNNWLWSDVRAYAAASGWTIEPIPDKHEPRWLEYRNQTYELEWSAGRIVRILLHADGEATEIHFHELPQPLQNLI